MSGSLWVIIRRSNNAKEDEGIREWNNMGN
jgi:hypothetical protein